MPAGAIDFSSNDYLGMASHAGTVARLRAATQVGSGGSRLLSGAHPEHVALEADLAAWTGREAALLFSSGYLAALGAIVALAPFVDYIASDERNHACAIDAVRLTKLPRTIHAHDAPLAPDPRVPTMFVTESLFGMTGTRIDVAARVAMLAPDDVLVVDEAHALGVVGPAGAGACAPYADPRIVVIGTLSKALGGLGGFVAGPRDAIAYLATAARTFVFDTAMPPALAAALRASLAIVAGAEGDRRRAHLGDLAALLRREMHAIGVGVPEWACGPIVPILLGDAATALRIGRHLEACGIYAPAIRPPTVPPGASQLRVTLRYDHTPSDVRAFAAALASACSPC
ncbi:MAG: 8-amino-7-oxononanoate synthase [Vulcanimicrobiaceae bacterium]